MQANDLVWFAVGPDSHRATYDDHVLIVERLAQTWTYEIHSGNHANAATHEYHPEGEWWTWAGAVEAACQTLTMWDRLAVEAEREIATSK